MTGRKGERSSGERRGGQQGILPWGFRSRRPSTRRSGFGLRRTVAYGGRVHDANGSRSRRRQRLRPSGGEGREWGEGKRGDEASTGLVEAGCRGAQALGRAAARALPRRTGRRRQHLLSGAAGCYPRQQAPG